MAIKEIKEKECIKKLYSNRILIIDEVHNLRSNLNGSSEEANSKKIIRNVKKNSNIC